MKESTRNKEIKVGIVTITAIILFIIGISLGNKINVGAESSTVKIQFPNSSGITISSPVYVNGVRRGEIISIESVENGVLIQTELDDISDFRTDVSARISMAEITGGKKIDIVPGTSGESYNSSDIINGTTSPDMGEMIAMLGTMGNDAQLLMKRLDTLASAAVNLAGSPDAQNKLQSTIDNTAEAVSTFNIFIQNNIRNLEGSIRNLSYITKELKQAIDKYEPKIDDISNKIDNTLTGTQDLIKDAELTIKTATELLSEFKDMAQDIKDGQGLAGKLLYDEKFSTKIDSTFHDLQGLLQMIKEHGINVNVRLGTRP